MGSLKFLNFEEASICNNTMPGLTNGSETPKKRKRKPAASESSKKKRASSGEHPQERDAQDEIFRLEASILESRTNYNSIQTLFGYLRLHENDHKTTVVAAVSLCRIFCRLLAGGTLNKPKEKAGNETTIAQWLRERLQDYEIELLKMIKSSDLVRQSTALTLLMRLVKEEAAHLNNHGEVIWHEGVFGKLAAIVVEDGVAEETRAEFVEKYVGEYDDVRYYTFARLAYVSPSLFMIAN